MKVRKMPMDDLPVPLTVAEEIFVYVSREMTSAGGVFFVRQDADMEGRAWILTELLTELLTADLERWRKTLLKVRLRRIRQFRD